SGTDLKRLGAGSKDTSVDGVTVIWFAQNPLDLKSVIVGWYKNATVYNRFQMPPSQHGHVFDEEPVPYKVSAAETDCVLLPVVERKKSIQNRYQVDGGYGQSPMWYGNDASFLDEI